MSIIKQYHKDTGITYVYESKSYWDKEKQQPRSKRKLIGKIDPETGKVVPTERRKKSAAEGRGTEINKLETRLQEQEKTISDLRKELSSESAERKRLEKILQKIRELSISGS